MIDIIQTYLCQIKGRGDPVHFSLLLRILSVRGGGSGSLGDQPLLFKKFFEHSSQGFRSN
jgi:hypothetical protein